MSLFYVWFLTSLLISLNNRKKLGSLSTQALVDGLVRAAVNLS